MNEVTNILSAIEAGDPHAAADLLPLVYDELRRLAAARLAAEKPGQTLKPTALVHEAYLRLVGDGQPRAWNGRVHFFAAAAEAMRRILLDRARRKKRLKHGGGRRRCELQEDHRIELPPDDRLLALDEALGQGCMTWFVRPVVRAQGGYGGERTLTWRRPARWGVAAVARGSGHLVTYADHPGRPSASRANRVVRPDDQRPRLPTFRRGVAPP